MCHVPGSSNFIWTGVEFSDGFGLPPNTELQKNGVRQIGEGFFENTYTPEN